MCVRERERALARARERDRERGRKGERKRDREGEWGCVVPCGRRTCLQRSCRRGCTGCLLSGEPRPQTPRTRKRERETTGYEPSGPPRCGRAGLGVPKGGLERQEGGKQRERARCDMLAGWSVWGGGLECVGWVGVCGVHRVADILADSVLVGEGARGGGDLEGNVHKQHAPNSPCRVRCLLLCLEHVANLRGNIRELRSARSDGSPIWVVAVSWVGKRWCRSQIFS